MYTENFELQYTLTRDVKEPERGTLESAGVDFFVPFDFNNNEPLILKPKDDVKIPAGVKVKVPKGFAGIFFNKSGIATKKHLQVGACVVDSDYEGEVHLHLTNIGDSDTTIEPGMKITQMVLLPVNLAPPVKVNDAKELYSGSKSERGEGGFGSTGI